MICARRLLPLVACVALAACGAQEPAGEVRELPAPSTQATAPAAAADAAPPAAPPPSATTGTAEAPAPPAVPEAAPGVPASPGGASAEGAGTGGAGDEEPIRQPARFTLAAGDVQPASVRVAPFLAVALEVVNDDAIAHRVRLVGTDVALSVAPGQSGRREVAGLAAGMYTLSVDGGGAASALVVGGDAAP